MRRYECFRRRERFLGVLVFAKLIRISIADILVVSVITRARCKTEPKASPVDEISNLPVHLGSLLPLNGSVPSLLLSINIADWHTSKQNMQAPYILHILFKKERHPPGCLRSFVQILPMVSSRTGSGFKRMTNARGTPSYCPSGSRDTFVHGSRFDTNDLSFRTPANLILTFSANRFSRNSCPRLITSPADFANEPILLVRSKLRGIRFKSTIFLVIPISC